MKKILRDLTIAYLVTAGRGYFSCHPPGANLYPYYPSGGAALCAALRRLLKRKETCFQGGSPSLLY